MKGYIENLNGLHIKYIIINIIIAVAGFITTLIVGKIGLGQKTNMYISIIMMICILLFFIGGRKIYQRELAKMKDFALGKKLNSYHESNKKRLKSFTIMSVIAIIGLVLSNNMMYLIFCVLSLMMIILNRTNKAKIAYELNLTSKEVEKLGKPIGENKSM